MDIKRLVITLCLVHALNSIIVFAAGDPCLERDKNCYSTQSTETCIAKKQRIDNHLGAVCCCRCSPSSCAIDGVHCHRCPSGDSSTPTLEVPKIIAQPDAEESIVEKLELKVSDTEEPGVEEWAVVTPDIKESDFDNPTVEAPDVTLTTVTRETDAVDLDAGGIEEEEIRPVTKRPVVSLVPTKHATKASFGYKDTVIVILSIAIVILFSILITFCIQPELRDQIKDQLPCCKSLPVPKPVDEEEAFVDNEKDIEDLL